MTDESADDLPEVDKEHSGGAQQEEKVARREGVERMLSGREAPQEAHQPGSKEEQADADTAPAGVGESLTRGAEDVAKQEREAGRVHTGTKGATERPTGTSTGRDVTGVDPQGAPAPSPE